MEKSVLTTPQENICSTEAFYGHAPISHIGGIIIFNEKPDLIKLQNAVNAFICSNSAMRTRIDIIDTTQTFASYAQTDFICMEFAWRSELMLFAADFLRSPFPDSGQLYDFILFTLQDGRGGYIFKLHHYIADGYSSRLLTHDIAELYVGNECATHPSYQAFIDKCDKYRTSSKYLRDKAYWTEKYNFSDEIGILFDGTLVNIGASRRTVYLTAAQTKVLHTLSESIGVSPAVVAEAAAMLYIHDISGQKGVGLCTLSANRLTAEDMATFGEYNTIIPLYVAIDEADTFKSLCERITAEHFSVYRNCGLSFDDIAACARESGKQRLFDCMVSYQQFTLSESEKQLYASSEWLFNGCSELPLEINICEDEQGCTIHYDYQDGVLCEKTIHELHERLMAILAQAGTDLNRKLCDIEITCKEDMEAYASLNATEHEIAQGTLLDGFLKNAELYPNRVALWFGNSSMTYGELLNRSKSFAAAITEKTSLTGGIVAVMLYRSFDMLAAIYGVLLSGNAYMPIDPIYPQERIEYMLSDSGAQAVITDSLHKPCTAKLTPTIVTDCVDNVCDYSAPTVSPDDTAYVIYTSGSTGKPKGATLSHKSAVNRIAWMNYRYAIDKDDIVLHKTPFTFDVSVWELFWWGMYGASLCILAPGGEKEPAMILDALTSHRITRLHFVPSMLEVFLLYCKQHKDTLPTHFMRVFVSGEALIPGHIQSFCETFENANLHNLYGPTECTIDVTYHDCSLEADTACVPIGRPVHNTKLYIVNKHGKLLPPNTVGELCVSGILVGKGYINRPLLNAERFVTTAYAGRMYKTGDIATVNVNGEVEYKGRIDHQIKIRGLRVEIGEIESRACDMVGVVACAVTVVKNDAGGKALCLYYVTRIDVSEDGLREHLSRSLPDYMVPSYFIHMDSLPLSANGKIDRKLLPLPHANTVAKLQMPKTETENAIFEAISEVLGKGTVGTDTDLLDYGIDSLTVLRIVIELDKRGITLKVHDIYRERNISALAALFDSMDGELHRDPADESYRDISDVHGKVFPKLHCDGTLLTGASGFLGIHLLAELLHSTSGDIYCLVRSEKRMTENAERFFPNMLPNARVHAVIGDISKPKLGLSDDEYDRLCKKVGAVYHSAANVNHFCELSESMNANYNGTCNMIELAKTADARLHYVSTVSVSGEFMTDADEHYFDENTLYIGQHYTDNVYAHSKYLAEREVIKAMREGLCACVYRVGNLVWRYTDGAFQRNYENHDFYCLTKALIKINALPESLLNINFDLSPVDEIARAIVTASHYGKSCVMLMLMPRTRTLQDYLSHFSSTSIVTNKDFYDRAMAISSSDRNVAVLMGYMYRGYEILEQMLRDMNYDKTHELLKSLGFAWHDCTDKYINFFDTWR